MTSVLSSRLLSPSGVSFSFSRKYGSSADVVLVDLRELEDAVLAIAVVRRRVEAGGDAALRIDAARRVAAHLEREDARGVRRERQHLQVEHQLDVLVERVGHADRRLRQLARLAAGVVGLDLLDAALDLAHVVEVARQARAVGGAELACSAAPSCALIKSRMLLSSARRCARSSGVAPTPNS